MDGPGAPWYAGASSLHHPGMNLSFRDLALLRTRSALTRLLGLASILLSTLGQAREAQSQPGDKGSTPRLATRAEPGRYLMLGVNLGLTGPPEMVTSSTPTETWQAVGVEASAVRLPYSGYLWFGGYVDVVQVLPNRATRLSLGPEAGLGPVGVDAGLLGEYSGSSGRFNGGFQIRGLLTLGIISAYVSAPCLFDSDAHGFRPQVQYGLLLKVPLYLGE